MKKKKETLHNIIVLEPKIKKWEISPAWIYKVKNSILLSKQYFNNKCLIVYVNHVLLGFFMSG